MGIFLFAKFLEKPIFCVSKRWAFHLQNLRKEYNSFILNLNYRNMPLVLDKTSTSVLLKLTIQEYKKINNS
jgi:hypothetical protein